MFISRVFLPIPNTAFAQCRTSLIFPKSDQNRRFSISSTDFHSSNMLAPWQTSILHHSTLALTFRRRKDTSSNAQSKGNTLGEQKWVHEGLITESLANGMFRVRLDNEDLIIGYVSGRIRCKFILIIPGDRVKIEVSRYDSSRGRIIYRLGGNKDSKEARKKR